MHHRVPVTPARRRARPLLRARRRAPPSGREGFPGFVEFKQFVADDGERVTLVTFDSAEHEAAWRDDVEHRAAQQEGRDHLLLRVRRRRVLGAAPPPVDARTDVAAISTRSPAWARSAMVATSNRLAVEAALWALGEGGTAVDAAIAADAVLGVVQPQSTGIGGDAFALVAEPGATDVVGFNGSGAAPASLTLEQCLVPDAWHERSPLVVTVPGVVDAWEQLVARYGRLDLATTLRPAIELAEHGFPIGRISARGLVEHGGAPAARARAARAPGAGATHHQRRAGGVAARHRSRRTRRAHDRRVGSCGSRRGAGRRRMPHARRPRAPPRRVGHADQRRVPRPRGAAAPAQRPGRRRARRPGAPGRRTGARPRRSRPTSSPSPRAIRAGMEDAHAHVADPRVRAKSLRSGSPTRGRPRAATPSTPRSSPTAWR